MPVISQQTLIDYRKTTFNLAANARLKSVEQALRYIDKRGFIFFWPARGITLPSLWTAAAGDRPVADEHDDPGHVTWGWKDGLLGKRRCYYAKLLRRRGTFVSNRLTPCFYALSENYGSPEEDYLIQYQEGRLTQEARQVYETLLDQGPLDTIALRKKAHLTSREGDTRFNKALDQLMADFKILPVGTTDAGGWHYSYLYDTVSHYDPGLSEQARPIAQKDARAEILKSYFLSVGAAQPRDIQRLFQWQTTQITSSLSTLAASSFIYPEIEISGQQGTCYALRQLV
jgi:hypothetical protein